MKRQLFAFMLSLFAFVTLGNVSEADWLSCFQGCEVDDKSLGEPKIPTGATPLKDPSLLVGEWEGVFDSLSYLLEELPGMVKEFHSVQTKAYRFSSDGTYDCVIESKNISMNGINLDDVHKSRNTSTGTWRLEGDVLVLVQMALSMVSDHVNLDYKTNIEKRLRVFLFNREEIGFQYATKQDLLNFKLAETQTYARTQLVTVQFAAGYDKYGFEVVRSFNPKIKSGGVRMTSPSHFKRVASPLLPKPALAANPGLRHGGLRVGQKLPIPAEDASKTQPVMAARQRPPYVLDRLEWVEGKDFALVFEVKLRDECSIKSFFGIQREFENEVRQFYCVRYPRVDTNSLVFDFKPALKNGRITGQVEVLTITPVSLTYDSNTRKGMLAVRYNANQFVEAREWIRRHIETLARDKNIALTTGEIPPAAKFYLGNEELKAGNVLEIEFRTE